jgi:hypothetical protein
VSSEPDLRTGLADIDRRLRALQEELSGVDAPPRQPPPPRDPEPDRPVREPPRHTSAPAPPRDRTAEDLALAIIARAEQQASDIVSAAHDRVVALNRQAQELMELRDGLRRSARELLRDYDAALTRLEGGESLEAPAAMTREAETPPQPQPPEEPAPRPYSGSVTLAAGAFADVADLATFAEAVGRVPGAREVTVDRFDGRHADLAIQLDSEIALATELQRVVPFAIEVEETDESTVSVALQSVPRRSE